MFLGHDANFYGILGFLTLAAIMLPLIVGAWGEMWNAEQTGPHNEALAYYCWQIMKVLLIVGFFFLLVAAYLDPSKPCCRC